MSKVKVRPLFDRLLIQRDEAEKQTKGGIILPDSAKDKPQRGRVIAVGDGQWTRDGKERVPMDVKVGDVVLFGPYAGSEADVGGGEKVLVLNQIDVLAILEV
jgi:chaperonin GroES